MQHITGTEIIKRMTGTSVPTAKVLKRQRYQRLSEAKTSCFYWCGHGKAPVAVPPLASRAPLLQRVYAEKNMYL